MTTIEVPDGLAGERLDRAIALLADISRSSAATLVAGGGVEVNDAVITQRSHRLATGDELRFDTPASLDAGVEADPEIVVDVVHQDDEVLVVDKPAGLVVHPGSGHGTGTLVHGLLARYPELRDVGQDDRPGIVHRLDAGTSGLLMVARTPDAYESLVEQLAERQVHRVYDTLVWGRVDAEEGVVDAPIGRSSRDPTRMAVRAGGREARTRYRVTSRWSSPRDLTRLTCRLETGRTHQIRVHLTAIGHPVVGDDRYRGSRSGIELARPFLHATSIGFVHPTTGEALRFDSPLPADLQAVLDDLGPPDEHPGPTER
jgi:23S rRNA pseudouridine1911/1915/1917 synthase